MPVLDSRMYIMINDLDQKEALIIDPLKSEEALSILNTLTHAVVLFTHSHYDHISGMNWLRDQVSCTLLCSVCCGNKIGDPHQNLAAFSNILIMDKTEEEQALCMDFFELDYICQADTFLSAATRLGSPTHQDTPTAVNVSASQPHNRD